MHTHDHDSGVGIGMVLGIILAILLVVLVMWLVLGANLFVGRAAAPAEPRGGNPTINVNPPAPTINVNPPAEQPGGSSGGGTSQPPKAPTPVPTR